MPRQPDRSANSRSCASDPATCVSSVFDVDEDSRIDLRDRLPNFGGEEGVSGRGAHVYEHVPASEVVKEAWCLGVGHVEHRLRLVLEAPIDRIPGDTDDLPIEVRSTVRVELPSHGISVSEEAARQGLVDHRDVGRTVPVELRERSPLDQLLPDGLEISRRDDLPQGETALVGRDLDPFDGDIAAAVCAAADWRVQGHRRGLNPWPRVQAIQQLVEELDRALTAIAGPRRAHAHQQHVRRVEPGLHGQNLPQAVDEQAGSHGEQHRERHLRNHQSPAQPCALRP